jgi:hypothetical protein
MSMYSLRRATGRAGSPAGLLLSGILGLIGGIGLSGSNALADASAWTRCNTEHDTFLDQDFLT